MADDFHAFSDTSDEYNLVFEEHPGYFFACIESDTLSPELLNEYKQKMADQISKRRYDRVMIKRDVPLTKPPMELCSVIYLVDNWKFRNIKYAFVDVNPQHLDAYKLPMLYARSLGMEIEVFGDVQTAEKWLLT
jgi:hypothetical protein